MPALTANNEAIIDLIQRIETTNYRSLIALAGPPGSGKSTQAQAVVDALTSQNIAAALLPMDGFHLDNEHLERIGLLFRKGSPDTFDAQALVELVQRVKTTADDIYYPTYDRSHECTVPNSGLLTRQTRVVVIEGNYLLLDAPIWKTLAPLFDATVFLKPSIETLERRLIDRWLGYGHDIANARKKAEGNDLLNARLVLNQSLSADLVLSNDD